MSYHIISYQNSDRVQFRATFREVDKVICYKCYISKLYVSSCQAWVVYKVVQCNYWQVPLCVSFRMRYFSNRERTLFLWRISPDRVLATLCSGPTNTRRLKRMLASMLTRHLRWHRWMNTLPRRTNTKYRGVLCMITTLAYRLYSFWLLKK
jgi:hypothetical protein